MSESTIEKDDWNTILGELDEIVREIDRLASMAMGDRTAFEGEDFPALIHFIGELKKEKKSQSWEKIENFAQSAKENLKFLEETQQIKMQGKRIDRSFIGVLPKNTDQIGKNALLTLNDVPIILRTINESVEAMLIDMKLKLGFPIVKFEKEILNIKHQIDLLEEKIRTHSKTKKGLVSRDEQVIYTQAYREKYHEIIEKAENYITRGFKTHSKAFEDVYDRFQTKLNNYRASPAFDDFIKENCSKVNETIDNWPKDGFKAFTKALKFIRKIDDRLSDTRQTYIQQIKAELDKDVSELISNIEKLYKLEIHMDSTSFTRMKESSEKVVSAAKFLARTVDVVAEDPYEKLVNDEKIIREATAMATSAFEGTYGSIEEKLNEFIKQVPPSKSTKKILDEIAETKGNCLDPNSLVDVVNAFPGLLDYRKNIDLLLKEIATDIVTTQDKFVKKIKNINKILGQTDAIDVPSDDSLVKISSVNLDDFGPLKTVEGILKGSLAQAAKAISELEGKFSEGLGVSINPNLEGKIARYIRPSYKPTVKQANKAMNDLEKFAINLAKDTGIAINEYVKDLKKFKVKSEALTALQKLLKSISKDATSGKITLTVITTRLEQAIKEYSKLLDGILTEHTNDLTLIMKDMNKVHIGQGMELANFGLKHDELISNISLESVMEQKGKEEPELVCKKCNSKIVWQQGEYNEMLGLDVLKVRCEKGHEDTIIGFGDEEEEEEVLEIKCSKCGSESLVPTKIDLFTKENLIVFAACPKKHESEFIIKKN